MLWVNVTGSLSAKRLFVGFCIKADWMILIILILSSDNNNKKHFKRPLTNVTKARAATRIPWPYTSVNQNKNDVSVCLKVPNVTAGSRSAVGRAFQDAGPEVLKGWRWWQASSHSSEVKATDLQQWPWVLLLLPPIHVIGRGRTGIQLKCSCAPVKVLLWMRE